MADLTLPRAEAGSLGIEASRARAEGWAGRLLARDGDDAATAQRLALGLGLSWVFGASAALTSGAWLASLGVPAMLAIVGSLGVPSVVIGLVLTRSEIDARDAARAAVHGIATTGLVLGGLAPASLLYLASTTNDLVRFLVLSAALALAGVVGLARMGSSLLASVEGDGARRAAAFSLVLAFAAFSGVLALRLWASVGAALVGHERLATLVIEGGAR
jgi:hypothetical protein